MTLTMQAAVVEQFGGYTKNGGFAEYTLHRYCSE